MKPNKELKGSGGIYLIRNNVTGKVYVGRTSCFYKRCRQYMYDIREQRRDNINNYLLDAINELGICNFEFVVVELCDVAVASQLELAWTIKLMSTDRDHGYNLRTDTRTGMVAHPETVEKIRGNITRQWAAGIRDGHSEKMKAYWARPNSHKAAAANTLRLVLTKYTYKVHLATGCVEVLYIGLVKLGCKNAVGSFHRNRSDTVVYKGIKIERVRNGS